MFDVTKGARHYGPVRNEEGEIIWSFLMVCEQKGGYHFFAGRDATRAFATGCFKEECLLSDLEGLTPEQVCACYEGFFFLDKSHSALLYS